MGLPDKQPKVFGIVELRVAQLLTDVVGSQPTYGTAQIVQGIGSLVYTNGTSIKEGIGDERIQEVEIEDEKAEVTFETLYFPMALAQIINGGLIVDNTNDSDYNEPAPDETASYVKIIALTKNRLNMLTLWKVKGRLDIKGFTTGDFVKASFKGEAIHTLGNVGGVKPRRLTFKNSTVTLAIGGVMQVVTIGVSGSVSTAGNATVIVTTSGMTGSPITLAVGVALNDSAAVVAQKIREAMLANSYIAGLWGIAGTGTNIVLTKLASGANDSTAAVSIANGTCAGLTASASTQTVIGQA